jgi:ComEC/Rec2-related protein
MQQPTTKTPQPEENDPWLWIPALFGFGVAFYLSFEINFLEKIYLFATLFFVAAFCTFLNRDSFRSFIFIACATFLAGCFYAKFFSSHSEITGKIYVDGVGKVESIKKFYNSANGVEGVNLVIVEPELYRSKFVEKKKVVKKKKVKKSGPNKSKKKKVPKKISEKKIEKDFLNLAGFQELDRKFLDYSANYQQVAWQEINGREAFPNPPQKISINLIKNFQNIAVNDVIALRLMLQPPQDKEFPDDFDFALDAKAKKIGAYGFALGEAEILQKGEISSSNEWLLSLREKIRGKILAVLDGDEAAIALAFLIGDQNQISKDLMVKIRNSGLAHLLSISGFHLALAGAIFFISTRFILSRSEYLTLHFDLKKIAAIAAIFATYFYLKIAASPLPAQRAFLMVVFVLLALFFSEKINSRRAVMTVILLLILFNPYAVFNVSFQLSFAAILTLGIFYEEINLRIKPKFLRYFLEITLVSIFIQIATLPFLMHSFQNVVLLGFVANILAIPLTSFFIMPLGFLALFLMPLNLEKYFLLLMENGILMIEKITIFVADLDHSHFVSPQLSSLGLVIAIFGLLLICLTKNRLRFVGMTVFALSFTTIFFDKKPDILFDGEQKFFAIHDENGLVFSKKLRPSKQRELWMSEVGETEFKYLYPSHSKKPNSDFAFLVKIRSENLAASLDTARILRRDFSSKILRHSSTSSSGMGIKTCDEKKCLIEKNKKILVLLARNKISEICKNDFDVIVNLTAKYQLPDCIAEDKIKIDNSDFYQKGGHFFYFNGDELLIKTTF